MADATFFTTQEVTAPLRIDRENYREKVAELCDRVTHRFRRVLHWHMAFHTLFALVGMCEFLALVVGFPFFVRSSVLAIVLATCFLTGFSYFALRMLLATKKPDQLRNLRDRYVDHCKELIHYHPGIPDHHLALASALSKLTRRLHETEQTIYAPPKWLNLLRPTLERLSAWCHWKDLLQMRELLLKLAIEEHISLIQLRPTSLEAHAALANAYVMLSGVYLDPKRTSHLTEELEEQYRETAERAIEEFKILCAYAPDDPWVHAQLAYSYRDLHMPEEEIGEYETILQLLPDDTDTLFKLGMRYFQSGHNAKGLEVYEALKRSGYQRADDLMTFYGS